MQVSRDRAVAGECGAGPPRFVRRTSLRAGEYRKNFRQIDADIIAAVTSAEADRVTPLMSKIYLRLVSAPKEFWEREGVLYFSAGDEGGRPLKASKVLYDLLGVASATAHKALRWMHEEGIIGYFAGRNGAGIRIFLNRAQGSIGVRADAAGKKILPFARGSNGAAAGSFGEPAFKDSYAVSEASETDSNPRAPKSGAGQTARVEPVSELCSTRSRHAPQSTDADGRLRDEAPFRVEVPVEEIVSRLRREIEPSIQSAARLASAREHERTREWLESRGLPKAARVAQRETYNLLRRCRLTTGAARATHAAEVGRRNHKPDGPRPLGDEEVRELAEACVALLETRGQPVEVTLAEMSAAAGGFLLPEDEPRVRRKALSLVGGSRVMPEGRGADG